MSGDHSDDGIVRGSLSDVDGHWDIAYVSMAGVAIATIGPIFIMSLMSMVAYFRCTPAAYLVKDALTIVECKYDPQPLGTAIGLACGGFALALGALAAYMAATRPPRPAGPAQAPSPVNIQMQPTAPPAALAAGPEAIAILQPPDKLARTAKGRKR